MLGCDGLSRTDERRFALGVLNAALGGGMSSRLFQEVREKRGLAYSVYSFSSQHADTGMWGVYAGCLPAKADEVLAICRDEIAKVDRRRADRRRAGPRQGPAARVDRARPGGSVVADEQAGQVRAGLPAAGAGRRDPGPIEAVTHDDVREVAAERAGPAQGARGGRPVRRRGCLCRVARLIWDRCAAQHAIARRAEGTMIKVGVLGAKGRMGSEVMPDGRRRARPRAGRCCGCRRRPGCRWPAVTSWWTSPTRARSWTTCAGASTTACTVVVGTSGFDDARLATVRHWLADVARPPGH